MSDSLAFAESALSHLKGCWVEGPPNQQVVRVRVRVRVRVLVRVRARVRVRVRARVRVACARR